MKVVLMVCSMWLLVGCTTSTKSKDKDFVFDEPGIEGDGSIGIFYYPDGNDCVGWAYCKEKEIIGDESFIDNSNDVDMGLSELYKEKEIIGGEPIIDKSKDVGRWGIHTQTSNNLDGTMVMLYVSSNDIIHSGYKKVRPLLSLTCSRGNETSVYVNWDLFIATSGEVDVTFNFDNQLSIVQTWGVSSSYKITPVPYNQGIALIKDMLKHNKLVVRVTPYGESPVMAEFNISHLKNVIAPLTEVCPVLGLRINE